MGRNGGGGATSTAAPCAACRLLRRKCVAECPFAPYFHPSDPHRFAAVHKVFGASNVSKMLLEVGEGQRADTANSLVYEAKARMQDPVLGCLGIIAALQQQSQALQAELHAARTQIMRLRFHESAMAATATASASTHHRTNPILITPNPTSITSNPTLIAPNPTSITSNPTLIAPNPTSITSNPSLFAPNPTLISPAAHPTVTPVNSSLTSAFNPHDLILSTALPINIHPPINSCSTVTLSHSPSLTTSCQTTANSSIPLANSAHHKRQHGSSPDDRPTSDPPNQHLNYWSHSAHQSC